MQEHLRDAFERELDAEPPPPLGNVIEQAMRQGTRLRRRRTVAVGAAAASVLAVLATAAGLAVPALRTADAPHTSAAATQERAAATLCEDTSDVWYFRDGRSDVEIYLRHDVTAAQISSLNADLRVDPLVRTVQFDSREAAYAKFKDLYRDSPDVARSAPPELHGIFRVELKDPRAYQTFTARFTGRPGIGNVVDHAVPPCRLLPTRTGG